MKKQRVRFEDFRATIKCPECGDEMGRADEGYHIASECTKQLVTCRFCETELPGVIASEHEKYCGSKTDLCKKCGRFVMVRDLTQHLDSCEETNPALPCEFCEKRFPANKLVTHQKKCFKNSRLGNSYVLNVNIGDTLRGIGKKMTIKVGKEHESLKQGREKVSEANEEFVWLSGRNERKTKKLPKSHRESISVQALPCEICGELCPSDTLMQHQRECQQGSADQNDPKAAGQSSYIANGFVYDSPPIAGDARYIEVQRGYSPTMEFEDDSVQSSQNIVFLRSERSSINFPPIGSDEAFQARGDADVSTLQHEIQRSYSPVIQFGGEDRPGIFTTFFQARDPFIIRRYPPRPSGAERNIDKS